MDQWTKIHQRFDEWTAPLKPSPEDVQIFSSQIKQNEKVLLLGATYELIPLAHVTIDNNPDILSMFSSSIVLGDWADLPFDQEFDVIIGDGCLTVFQGTVERFFQQMKKALKPGGRLILRTFISPEIKEDLQTALNSRKEMGFHGFKWRVAHAVANPYIKVKDLEKIIRPIDDHPTLEVYRGSELTYYFPSLSQLPPYDTIFFSSSYELAERCPIIVWSHLTQIAMS